ncbi:serine endoprotease DegQ, partial [Klebsiella pneumoniae]|nr:serine endoprotease DegQ [Klebsiella pneumoniae]
MLEKVLPAVRSVLVEGTASPTLNMPEELKNYYGDKDPKEQAQPCDGLRSGVILDAAKGSVLTTNHVITQAPKIRGPRTEGRECEATRVG